MREGIELSTNPIHTALFMHQRSVPFEKFCEHSNNFLRQLDLKGVAKPATKKDKIIGNADPGQVNASSCERGKKNTKNNSAVSLSLVIHSSCLQIVANKY
jgi:hypothetical protein